MSTGAALPIDLLNYPARPSHGIDRHPDGGFVVRQPWAGLELEPLVLPAGWYWLEVEGPDCAACLELSDTTNRTTIELSAESGTPAYVRLGGGIYHARLLVGGRPGIYPASRIVLSVLPLIKRLRLFCGRALAALRAGASPRQLYVALQRALQPKGSFGMRAQPAAGLHLGPLARRDFARMASGRHRFLPATPDGPVFLIRRPTGADNIRGLDAQTYRRFTLDPDAPHDAEIVIGAAEQLTPDALATFADIFVRQPDVSVVISDAWVGEYPSANVAFDPLLYRQGYPTPFAIRTGFVAEGGWQSQQPRFAVSGFPLSFRDLAIPIASAHVAAPPRVPAAIVIPTRDRADLLRVALTGLFGATDWPHEVVVVDNGSVEPETFALFDEYRGHGLKVVRADMPFNFSALCNLGAQASKAEFLVFMNNDIELIRPDWLANMIRLAVRDDVGAVGGRLYYPDKRLQHGGVALGLTQLCGHPWRGLAFADQQDVSRLRLDSLRSAVTGALLCVSRARFDAVDGFDEIAFPVTLNDVDLCLKLQSKGWFSAYAAEAEAIHHEGESRGQDNDPQKRARRQAELDAFAAKWPDRISSDPWMPASVSRATERFDFR